ncbi:aspartate/glutamate racemase family protein [Staphylococcus kloosii]|jgi:aspartate racemase|uniref:aspartate/glutamate racemase family protein n=1 Tax=Staphylococcus kloosii TaxID=29384 RepID=UPI00189F0CCF|nr:amino acid racemase [Staphylococcus kloosii]MBF7023410.1 amino acid racemase [Staphylococcus kloosii]
MKRVGIIGGLGPESTVDYYKSFIHKYQYKVDSKQDLPELFINSINMYNIFKYIDENRLEDLAKYVGEAAQKLEQIGADFIIIAANTPHIVFNEIEKMVEVPMISIVDATYEQAEEQDLQTLGLLGTKFTMTHDFFKTTFRDNDKNIVVPHQDEQEHIHKRIVDELENGIVNEKTKDEFLSIINRMIQEDHIDGIILGCTELQMLLNSDDFDIPLLETMDIHVNKMVEKIFE